MRSVIFTILVGFCLVSPLLADSGHHHHAVPTLTSKTTTTMAIRDNTVTLTFGPIDLPAGHDGDLAASMPKHAFQLPKDMYLVGYKTAVFTKDGTPLPKNYLHHILGDRRLMIKGHDRREVILFGKLHSITSREPGLGHL